MRLLEQKTETELLLTVSCILAAPGDFTPRQRHELALINAEFLRRSKKEESTMVTMTNHNSSMITQSGYDDTNGEMHLTFAKGGTYKYRVPKEVHDQLVAAPSIGKFYHANKARLGQGVKV